MKIYILDTNAKKLALVDSYFKSGEVETVCDTLQHFVFTHDDVECVVSPANSFGLMDGGYDAAITDCFGGELQKEVQKYILSNYFGEQPVGTSFLIKIPHTNKCLIHTPTMRTPEVIRDKLTIYQCMRSTLMCAIKNDIKSIVIPLFGGGCGGVHPQTIAYMMKRAYVQITNPPTELTWEYAISFQVIAPV